MNYLLRAFCSASIIVFLAALFYYFYKRKIDELTPRQQLVLIEIGEPKISFFPLKPSLPLHHFVLLLLISTGILIAYRFFLLSLPFLTAYLPSLSFFLIDRSIVFVLFLSVLYPVVILFIISKRKKIKMISILIEEEQEENQKEKKQKKEKKKRRIGYDYFIRVKREDVKEAVKTLNKLLFYLYAPTNFIFLINSQTSEWKELTKGILYGKDGERGILGNFSNYTLVVTPEEEFEEIKNLFSDEKNIFLLRYSAEKMGEDVETKLNDFLEMLSRFTYESKPAASLESGGRYGFDVARFHEVLGGCRWLCFCNVPKRERFPLLGAATSEVMRKLIGVYRSVDFDPKSIKKAVIFDILESDYLKDENKLKGRADEVKVAVATEMKIDQRNMFLYVIEGKGMPPPLLIFGGE